MAVRFQTGEPYELAGRRLVFTNWRFIRPGHLRWNDDEGRNVSVYGDEGPLDAHFRFTEAPYGIRLRAHPGQKMPSPVVPEEAWESGGINVGSWLQDDGLIRAWGSCGPESGERYLFYAESTDGESWDRPKLGLQEFHGSRDNNLFAPADEFGNVFIDPSADDDERYKWVLSQHISREEYDRYRARRPDAWDPASDRVDVLDEATPVGEGGQILSMRGAVSPDGVRWNILPDPLVVEHTDTDVVAYYDTFLKKYVAYVRDWDVGARSQREGLVDDRGLSWIAVGRRSIGRTETDDFRNFPLSDMILTPGPDMLPSDVLYTNCRTTIPGAPDLHLMFPSVWHTANDTTSVILASSSDGKTWHYLPGGPVLETSPFGQWDGGCVFAGPGLVEFSDGTWALRYTGYNVPHKYPRGGLVNKVAITTWPHGRMISLEAAQLGQFSTVAIIPPGRKLRLNARTMRGGSIRVEAAHVARSTVDAGTFGEVNPRVLAGAWSAEGRTFDDSNPIIGDHPSVPVTWRGTDDLGHGDGDPVILRFRLDQAEIFGLEFD